MFDPEDELSLAEFTGLEVSWAEGGTLRFADSIVVDEVQPCSREQLRPVALDPASYQPADLIQYWSYVGIARRRDRERILATGLRYGLTALQPTALGKERSRTLGLRFNHPSTSTLSYSAICEVLSGSAWFLFQMLDEKNRSAPYCAIQQARPGDKIIIPPNLYHCVVNAGDAPLLFSTIASTNAKRIYAPLGDLHGEAWHNLLDEGWVKNPFYQTAADPEWWSPTPHPELGLTPNRPLYHNLVQLPESLLWLLEPMSFPDIFPDIWDSITHLMRNS